MERMVMVRMVMVEVKVMVVVNMVVTQTSLSSGPRWVPVQTLSYPVRRGFPG